MDLGKTLVIQADRCDSVGTTLGDLSPGDRVSVVNYHGERMDVITARSYVPRFFKIALNRMHPGDPVLKWGSVIGEVPDSRISTARPLIVAQGDFVHVGNFVPSRDFVEYLGADPSSQVSTWFQQSNAATPFQLGRVSRTVERDGPIEVGMLRARDSLPVAGTSVLPSGLPAAFVLGYALQRLPAGAKVHFGNIVGQHYEPSRDAETLAAALRVLRSRIVVGLP